jgi:predicted phosphodiesterase
MLKCILLLIILALPVYAQNAIHSEILGSPTDKSIKIQIFFDQNCQVKALYGIDSNTLSQSTEWQNCSKDSACTLFLQNLLPDAAYYYRIAYRAGADISPIVRPVHSFHTQRKAGSGFVFTVQADPHMDNQTDTSIYRMALQNQLADKPDFMIDLGDIIMTDKLRNASKIITRDTILERCHLLRSWYEKACHSIPLFIALGNHEGEAGWNLNGKADNFAVWSANLRKNYFVNPYPDSFYTGDTLNAQYIGQRGNYYAWQWGDALFIVLDPYWYTTKKPDSLSGWNWTLGQQQYNWLRSTLENKKAAYTFIFAHQIIGGDPDGRGGVEYASLYEWGGNNLDGTRGFEKNRPGWYKPIKDLLREHKVHIFFHGHDHFFAAQQKDCLIYQETPQPGHPNFMNAGQADDYGYKQGIILPNSGHLRITVIPERVKVEYIRSYAPGSQTANRKNGDISAVYTVERDNCYDSLLTGVPVLWNEQYADELVYPNPSKGHTFIQMHIPQDDFYTVDIIDMRGNIIRSLYNHSYIPVGKFILLWDGRDNQGSTVPTGTYLYSIFNHKSFRSNGFVSIVRE